MQRNSEEETLYKKFPMAHSSKIGIQEYKLLLMQVKDFWSFFKNGMQDSEIKILAVLIICFYFMYVYL